MEPRAINLASYGTVLSTRERGREAADAVQDALEQGGAVVSFAGVEVVTPSYLDELLSRLRTCLRDHPEAIAVVTDINEDTRDSLDLILAHRKMSLAHLTPEKVELLGGKRQLRETLDAAREMGTFTAPDLAERLKVKLPNLHQRLAALSEAGALSRTEDDTAERGRRYEWTAATPADADHAQPKGVVVSS